MLCKDYVDVITTINIHFCLMRGKVHTLSITSVSSRTRLQKMAVCLPRSTWTTTQVWPPRDLLPTSVRSPPGQTLTPGSTLWSPALSSLGRRETFFSGSLRRSTLSKSEWVGSNWKCYLHPLPMQEAHGTWCST